MKYMVVEVGDTQFRYKFQVNCFFTWSSLKDKNKVEIWNTPEEGAKIKEMEDMLSSPIRGNWKRIGNNFYIEKLQDAFWFRIYYDEDIRVLTETKGKKAA